MLSELEFFTTLIRAGSLSGAAGELNITPPAVSKRLVQLEERLGVRLLNRTTRILVLHPKVKFSLIGQNKLFKKYRKWSRRFKA